MVIRTPTTHLLQHFPLNGSRQGNCDNSNVARLPLGDWAGAVAEGASSRSCMTWSEMSSAGGRGVSVWGILDCVPQ